MSNGATTGCWMDANEIIGCCSGQWVRARYKSYKSRTGFQKRNFCHPKTEKVGNLYRNLGSHFKLWACHWRLRFRSWWHKPCCFISSFYLVRTSEPRSYFNIQIPQPHISTWSDQPCYHKFNNVRGLIDASCSQHPCPNHSTAMNLALFHSLASLKWNIFPYLK